MWWLTGCAYQPYYQPPTLTQIPLRPHEDTVRMWYGADRPQDTTSYYKAVRLRVEGPNDSLYLRQLMEEEARFAGVDGVIGLTQQNAYRNISYIQSLTGTGIKFRDSLDYVSRFVRSQYVFRYRDSTDTQPLLVYQANFLPNGEVDSARAGEGDRALYEYFVRNYSLKFLLQDRAYWSYLESSPGVVLDRRFQPPGADQWQLQVHYTYRRDGAVERIRLRYRQDVSLASVTTKLNLGNTLPRAQEIEITYDPDGFPAEKRIFFDGKLAFHAFINYDADDRIDHTVLYQSVNGKLYPFLQTVYEYHQAEDLPAPQ